MSNILATASVADRLSSTLFVAALAHGVVILGVTFTGDPFSAGDETPPLSVTLLVDADAPAESEAELLASRNALGGGPVDDSNRPTTLLSADAPLTQAGEAFGADPSHARPREAAPEAQQVATSSPQERRIQAVPDATDSPATEPLRAAALLDQPVPKTLAAELDDTLRSGNSDDGADQNGPSARRSIVAAYLVGWRQKIERIGTANFPREYLLQGEPAAKPVLEVEIGADGDLQEIVVRKSSGSTGLDQAALQILRMAAPFAPLPPEILTDRDSLRVVYEWDFSS